MTQEEKKALATSFKTSVGTLDQAYTKLNNQFEANIRKAHEANDVRQQKLVDNFNNAVNDGVVMMGCDKKCFQQAREDGKCPSEMFTECCDDDVVRVDFTEVNTAAIIERQYGDMENLKKE
jgi:hypothetical protein